MHGMNGHRSSRGGRRRTSIVRIWHGTRCGPWPRCSTSWRTRGTLERPLHVIPGSECVHLFCERHARPSNCMQGFMIFPFSYFRCVGTLASAGKPEVGRPFSGSFGGWFARQRARRFFRQSRSVRSLRLRRFDACAAQGTPIEANGRDRQAVPLRKQGRRGGDESC